MAKIIWNPIGKRFYETGVKNGVLYPANNGTYPKGVAWDGLISVQESPSGAEPTPLYASDIKYLNLLSAEEFGATVEAYTYPKEFDECNGTKALTEGVRIGQQVRKPFGMAYTTTLGNDESGDDYGYKIHLIYNALAAPSERAYQTKNENPEAINFSWTLSTTPVAVAGARPTSTLELNSKELGENKMKAIEKILYGDEMTEPRLPLPDEVVQILQAAG